MAPIFMTAHQAQLVLASLEDVKDPAAKGVREQLRPIVMLAEAGSWFKVGEADALTAVSRLKWVPADGLPDYLAGFKAGRATRSSAGLARLNARMA